MTAPTAPPGGRLDAVVPLLAGSVLVGLPMVWAVNPGAWLTRHLVIDQFLVVMLTAALVVVFWPVGRNPGRRWTGRLATFAVLVLAVPLFRHYGGTASLFLRASPELLAQAVALIGLCLWAMGRIARPAAVLALLALLAFGYTAQFLSGPFEAPAITPQRYVVYLVFGGEGLLGSALQVIATTVVVYVLFGAAYEMSGGTAFIDALARRVAGRSAGAPVQATIISSGLFGMISGSATSNVVTSGAVTIPAMRRFGLTGAQAGGIEAVSSTLGQVTPPVMGAAAFLMVGMTGIPYGTIVAAAALPALLAFWIMVLQAQWLGQRLIARGEVPDTGETPPRWAVFLRPNMLAQLLPIGAIFAVISLGEAYTVRAGIAGIVCALAVSWSTRGLAATLADLRERALPTMRTLAELAITGSVLGLILAVLNITGLDVGFTARIAGLGEDQLIVGLVLTAAVALVLGIGMSTSAAYIIVGTMLAPGLVAYGVPPVAAHLFVLYFALVSMITPPVGFAALAASSIAGASFLRTSLSAVRFGWSLYLLPFAFVYQPALLMQASPPVSALVAGAVVLALASAQLALSAAAPDRRASAVAAVALFLATAFACDETATPGALACGAAGSLALLYRLAGWPPSRHWLKGPEAATGARVANNRTRKEPDDPA